MEATKHCRSSASIFDVSHMLGSSIRGKDAVAFTQRLVVGDIAGLKPGTGTLSVVTNEQGGIIDDTVVTKVCLLYTSPSPRDATLSRMPSSA